MRRIPSLLLASSLFLLLTSACSQAAGVGLAQPSITPEPGINGTPPMPSPGPTQPASPTPTASPAQKPSPAFREAACAFEATFGRAVRCGYLTVPAHRDQPSGDTLRLHVAIIEAGTAEKAPDPVVYLAGGPGEKALDTLPFTFEFLGDFADDRDFIVFDQRGVGASEPSLDCPELAELTYETLDVVLPDEEAVRLALESTIACRDRLVDEGVDVTAYTSAESAADVCDLRLALGYDEWNLLGISYGTRLAQTVLRDHPEGIRSVVLDSSYPLEVNLYEAMPANFSRALDELFRECAEDSACAEAYPGLADQLMTAYHRLEEEPVRTTVLNPLTGESFEAVLDGDALVGQLFQGMYSSDVIPLLPELIVDATERNVDLLAALVGTTLVNQAFISQGMQMSVQCAEEVPFTNADALRAAVEEHPDVAPLFGDGELYAAELLGTCEAWGAAEAGAIEDQPVTSSVPTLVLAGQLDPITPPGWGELVSSNIEGSTFLVFPDQAHGAVSGECARSIAIAFLQDPAAELSLDCMDDLTAPEFVLPLHETEMVPFQSDTLGIAGLRPERWEETAPGTFTRSPAGETVLVQQAVPGIQASIYLGFFLQQLGTDESPTPMDSRTANGLTWDIYQVQVVEATVQMALTEVDGTTLAVIAAGLPNKQDALREYVFLPAVGALRLTPE